MKSLASFGRRCSHRLNNAIPVAWAGTFILALLLGGAPRTQAQLIWTGNTSADWNTATNWNTNAVPTASGNVSLNTGSGNQAVISTANATASFLTVGVDGNSTGNTTLTIQSGFTLTTSGTSIIGSGSNATGTVLVSGANSQWIASQNLTVGKFGTGNLTVANGGTVTAGDSLIDNAFGGVGSVVVTGSHSALNITNVFFIGGSNSGNGSLTVANGGNVTTRFMTIGNITNAQGTALVTDTNSTLNATGGVNIGNSGTGSLTVTNGGTVISGGDFGVSSIDQISQNGTLSVTGVNSTVNIQGNFKVGTLGGHGNVTVANGGQITGNSSLSMGEGGHGTGAMLVTGADSSLRLTGGIFLGGANTSLTLANGGKATAGAGLLLGTSFLNSTILVTDANTTLQTTGNINMTMGTITVANGATVISNAGVVAGGFLNNTAALLVTDAHSTLQAGGDIVAGSGGNGNLTVTNGGQVSGNGALVIGDGSVSPGFITGTVLVTGTNSTLQVAGDILAGDVIANNAGTGNLTVANGGTVASDGNLTIGVTSNISGTVVVTDASSTLTVANIVTVGANGTGNLTIANGGTVAVNGNKLTLASGAGSNATVNLNVNGTLKVGGTNGLQAGAGNYAFNFAGGTLQVTDADLTTAINATLAANTSSTLDTNGFNATWTGVLSGSGNLIKTDGNTLTLSGNNTYSGSTTISGGMLIIASNTTSQSGAIVDNAALVFSTGGNNVFARSISGNGTVVKSDNGTLALSGNNTYTGSTTVSGGTLLIANDGTVSGTGTGAVNVTANATLAGGGKIDGNTTINGTLQVGTTGAAGLLSFAQNLTLGANTTSLFQIGGNTRGTQYSTVNVASNVTFGGGVVLNLFNNFFPTLGATFDLFQFGVSVSGAFASVTSSILNLNFRWDDSQLNTTGDVSTAALNFGQWTATAGLSGNNALPAAKPYSGPANLIRYAMNLDLSGAPAGAPVVNLVNVSGTNFLVIEYRVRKNMTDYQLVPQSSPDMVTWTDVDAGNISPLSDADAYTAQYQASVPFPAHGSVFLRVVAQAAP